MPLSLSRFDYVLPPELIALYPSENRVGSRLLSINRKTGAFAHHHFFDLPSFLKSGDLLVLNNSRVLPARLFASRKSGGKIEIFLLNEKEPQIWTALVRPNWKVKKGDILTLGEFAQVEALSDPIPKSGERLLKFSGNSMKEILNQHGHMPLPPYIHRKDELADREKYQTVYAKEEGSVAAPTAGLHFDQALLETLKQKGIEIAEVTLHVGTGTFKPIECEDITQHVMHEEIYEINPKTASQINQARIEKRRMIACGTTSVRVLESAANSQGQVASGRGTTKLFIYEPYDFKLVQGMITNFHLPRSTLLCLVDAFLGNQKLLEIYAAAIKEKYRFYSYGDAMLIL